MKTILLILLAVTVTAQDYSDRLLLPHLYPGQTITYTPERFTMEALRPGTSTVRWTRNGSYALHLDKIHLQRESYTLKIKSKQGWSIRMLPFETTKIYLAPDYYDIEYDKNTYTVWLAKWKN